MAIGAAILSSCGFESGGGDFQFFRAMVVQYIVGLSC